MTYFKIATEVIYLFDRVERIWTRQAIRPGESFIVLHENEFSLILTPNGKIMEANPMRVLTASYVVICLQNGCGCHHPLHVRRKLFRLFPF